MELCFENIPHCELLSMHCLKTKIVSLPRSIYGFYKLKSILQKIAMNLAFYKCMKRQLYLFHNIKHLHNELWQLVASQFADTAGAKCPLCANIAWLKSALLEHAEL